MPNAPDIDELVKRVATLVSPPAVWLRIHEIVHDPDTTAGDLARVVMRDPALTARLLQIVNSPFFNLRARVDSITRAVTLIGTNELYHLATAITAANVFDRIPNNLVRPDTFWRHSIATGLVARRAAQACRVLHPERLYVAGMLHDIGSVILYREHPERASEALMAAGGDEDVLSQVEDEMFGFDHAQLGAALLLLWKLPQSLIDAVRFHHDPQRAGNALLDASLVHLADVAANRVEGSAFAESDRQPELLPDPVVWEVTGLAPSFLDETATQIEQDLQRTAALFLT